ncbi:MAG: hypothetical protein KDE55_25130 [Novosphingobium sp.]|nr:hypothetical protein [Novosphingobium sp.]
MSHLQRHSDSSLSPGSSLTRQGRAISRIVAGAELSIVRVAAAAHVEDARIDAIDHVTNRAMQGVALVALAEAQLTAAVPHAAGRLQLIANQHTMLMAGEVAGFSRRMPS